MHKTKHEWFDIYFGIKNSRTVNKICRSPNYKKLVSVLNLLLETVQIYLKISPHTDQE